MKTITPVQRCAMRRFALYVRNSVLVIMTLLLAACGGGDGSGGGSQPQTYTVTTTPGTGGTISPESKTVTNGDSASFSITPNEGYTITSVSGCGGSLNSNTCISDPVTTDCLVSASFSFTNHNVGGTMSRLSGTLTLQDNGGDDLTLTADHDFTFIGE